MTLAKPLDIIGKRFGRLTVVCLDKKGNTPRKSMWLCKCDCGNTTSVLGSSLISGNTNSCGCLSREMIIARNTKHGLTYHPLYTVYRGIVQRCTYEKDSHYKFYGAKGITICKEWTDDFKSFYEWALSSGWKKGLTIDRIDNTKGYKPSNCRWVTLAEQSMHKTNNRYITYNGKTQTVTEWSREVGKCHKTITYRLDHGYSVKDALFGGRYENIRKKNMDRKLQRNKATGS